MAELLDVAEKNSTWHDSDSFTLKHRKKCTCKEIGFNINSLSPMIITTETFYTVPSLKKDSTQFL